MIIKEAKGTESIKSYEEYKKRSIAELGFMFKVYRKDLKYPTKEECESIYINKAGVQCLK